MYIYGSFVNRIGQTVTVHILTNGDRSKQIEVCPESDMLCFPAESPVEITAEVNDTFDHLLRQSATIHLYASDFIADFFCTSARDAMVNIYRDGVCLFAGFIEPQTYSQPYNEVWDEVELNCIDVLSALQYSKYRNIGSLGVLYNIVKADAQQRTFYDIMAEILNGITSNLDIDGGNTIRYLYDGSKAVDDKSANHYTIFKQLAISELLFLGDEEDDVWQQDEALEEILKYLNLHIIQDGFTFYIFSWESIKGNAAILWRNIVNGQVVTTARKSIIVENEIADDCDTTVDIGDVYNQILLTCKIEDVENVIESPLDDDLLKSPYSTKQLYCTEYSADGEGLHAYNAFKAMCHDENTNYGAGRITDWFVRVMQNSQWKFPMADGTDLLEKYCASGTNQHVLPDYLATNPGAAIIAVGSVIKETAKDDNSPTSKVNMDNCLFVSVNGNGSDNESDYYPQDADIKARIPQAVYTGNAAGGNFSPADSDTTNYIVLSGKIVLNPLMAMTDVYRILHNDKDWRSSNFPYVNWWHKTVPSRDNGDGRYYTRKYWKATNPTDTPTWNETTNYGLIPFTGKGPEQYEFKYSAVGDGTDTISKIAALSCMLIIGDKCVVETGTDGQVSDFTWKKYKTLSECSSEDEYYQQSFTIGFDPKIGDKLIGTEFNLQNNISYQLGIDTEGIAIPIRKSDKVNGQVKFMILGPVNTIWDEITRRHPTFFRHTKWYSKSVPLLAHVSNIIVKQFEVKIYSDNGLINTGGKDDNDVIYMSDTREEFTNKKDDLEFKINSALTAAECVALGVTNSVKLSTPLNVSTGDAILTIYDYGSGQQAKAEQIYVDSYYREYHLPRVLMEQKLQETNGIIGLFHHYTHPALGKAFFVQGISRDLIEARADMKLKEIGE